MSEASAPEQTKAVVPVAPRPSDIVKSDLESALPTVIDILGGLDDEAAIKRARQLMKVTSAAIIKNPDLMECAKWPRGRASLMQAMVDAAEVGLNPTGNLNRAWVAPFKEKSSDPYPLAKLMIGYQGLADLMRDGTSADIWCEAVFEGDDFHVEKGLAPTLKHIPKYLTEDPNKIIAFYAVLFFPDGRTHFEVMTKAQVDGIRAKSRSGNGPAWTHSYPQMGRKTVLRRLANYVPLADRAAEAIQKDDEREFGPAEVIDKPKPVGTVKDRLLATVKPQDPPQPPQDAPGSPEGVSAPDESTGERTDTAGVVDAETTEVCGSPSPYGDGEHCVRGPGHKEKNCKGPDGQTWEKK